MIIEFSQDELKHISNIGKARTDENKHKHDIADYDKRRMHLTNEQANKLGVMGEAALVKYFGYNILDCPMETWVSFYTSAEAKNYKNAPDVFHEGQWFDTRRVEKRTNPVVIRKKDVEGNVIVVQVFIPYVKNQETGRIKPANYAEIIGWSNAAEDWEDAWRPSWAKTPDSRVIDPRPIEKLFEEEAA